MFVLSCPYSHSDVIIKMKRVEFVAKFVDSKIKEGIFVFSPVLYGLKVLQYVDGMDDWETWKVFCENAILDCKELWVLKMKGWELSTGVKGEIDFAIANNIPVKYIDVNEDYV